MVASYIDGYGKPFFYYGEERCMPIKEVAGARNEILSEYSYDSYKEISIDNTNAGEGLNIAAKAYLARTALSESGSLMLNLAYGKLGGQINLRVVPGERQEYSHSGCHTGTGFDDDFSVFNEPQTVFQEEECPDYIEKECDNCWRKIARKLIEAEPLSPKAPVADKKKSEYYNGYKAIENFLELALK